MKVDVRAAFDTIDQDKLIEILHELLSHVRLLFVLAAVPLIGRGRRMTTVYDAGPRWGSLPRKPKPPKGAGIRKLGLNVSLPLIFAILPYPKLPKGQKHSSLNMPNRLPE